MLELNFSYNWNNKLDCKAFTTLRLSDRFSVGDKVQINLKKKEHSKGIIIDKRIIVLDNINNYIAYIDTGYDKEECKEILKKMYKNKDIDWETKPIFFYLIKKIKE